MSDWSRRRSLQSGRDLHLCHFLKVDGKELDKALRSSSYLFVVTINGADMDGTGWNTLIQPLDSTYDVLTVLRKLKSLNWDGPVGLQHYGIRGSARTTWDGP